MTNGQRRIIVDLEAVSFLSSMGIRTIILGAKAVKSKGGRMVLLNPASDVEKTLIVSGIDTVVPILHELPSALAAVAGE